MTFHQLINLITCLQEFRSFIEFHVIYNTHPSYVKFSFYDCKHLKWWLWYNIKLLKNYTFQLFVDWSHLWLDLFLRRFQFNLLTFIEFSIYSRLFYFSPGWNFSGNWNFFQLGIPSWKFNPAWKSPYNRLLSKCK